jgi:hypothetical protein
MGEDIMNEERLKVLLYNALVCLEENGYDIEQLKESIGIKSDEYEEIMDI